MIRIFDQYISLKILVLAAAESLLIALCLWSGVRFRFWTDPGAVEVYTMLPDFAVQTAIVVITIQLCFYYNELYDLMAVRRRTEQLIRLGQSLGVACLILGLIYFIMPALMIGRGVFFLTMALVALSIVLTRLTIDSAWQVAPVRRNVLIVGTGRLGTALAQEISLREDLGLTVVGFVARAAELQDLQTVAGRPVLGRLDALATIAKQQGVAKIIVALEDRRGALPTEDLAKLRFQGVAVDDAQSALAALTGRIWLSTIRPSWFVFSQGFRRSALTAAAKRVIDLVCACAGLVLLGPLMLLIAAAVRLDSRGSILYRQTRVGLRGRCFELLKFRSMRQDAEDTNGAQWALADDPRATRVGRFLRKFRLDELPQFINVVRGDMSLVGPRPERPVFVEMLRAAIPYFDQRHCIRPGVTGWAQTQYTYGASVEDAARKLEYDLFYLKNTSVLFDFAIILQTVKIVLLGMGGR